MDALRSHPYQNVSMTETKTTQQSLTFTGAEVPEIRGLLNRMLPDGVTYTEQRNWWTFWRTTFVVTATPREMHRLEMLAIRTQDLLRRT
jgi:hypothetical protein